MKKKRLSTLALGSLLLMGGLVTGCADTNPPVVEATGTVTIECGAGGTVTPSATSGEVGTTITLTVTPDSGYELDTLTHNGTDIKEAKSFVLVEGVNRVVATFTQSGQVTPPVEETYTVSYTQSSDYSVTGLAESYKEGETVSFTVASLNASKEISEVKMDDTVLTGTDGAYSFTMPAKNVTLTITMKDVVVETYTVSYTQSSEYTITGLAESYKEGDTVSFTVSVTDPTNRVISSVTANGTALTGTNGAYSLTMGKENVVLVVTLANNNYDVTWAEAANIGPDRWYAWYPNQGDPWGSGATVADADTTKRYEDGVLKVSYKATQAGDPQAWFYQLFYRNSTLTANARYDVSMKIKSSVAGTILISEKHVALEAGDNDVTLSIVNTASSTLALQLGYLGLEASIEISDVTFVPSTETTKTVSYTESSEYTVSGLNSDGYYKYELVSFSVVATAEDKEVDTVTANGTPLTASGASYSFVMGSENVTLVITLKDRNIEDGKVPIVEGTEANMADNTWTYFVANWNGVVMNEAYQKDGVIHLDYTAPGGDWWGAQLFYRNTSLSQGTYTLSFKLNSTVAGTVKINGTEKDIVVGDNDISVVYENVSTSFSFQAGTESKGILTGSIVMEFSEIKWTQGDGTGTGEDVEDPTPDNPETPVTGSEITFVEKGSSATRIEGAGVWLWASTESVGITAQNQTNYSATATVSRVDVDGAPKDVTVSGDVVISDHNYNDGYFRIYVSLSEAPAATDKTTVNVTLTDGTNTWTGSTSFTGTTWDEATPEEDLPPVEYVDKGEFVVVTGEGEEHVTGFEGAGCWIWVSMDSVGMTEANFGSYNVTAELTTSTDGAGNPTNWVVNQAIISNPNYTAGHFRVYVALNGGPGDNYNTVLDVEINDGVNAWSKTLNFTGTTYVAG